MLTAIARAEEAGDDTPAKDIRATLREVARGLRHASVMADVAAAGNDPATGPAVVRAVLRQLAPVLARLDAFAVIKVALVATGLSTE